MGSGTWTTDSVANYCSFKGMSVDTLGTLSSSTLNQFYTSNRLNNLLNPKNIIRECVENEEHPNTIPIILALDVTGSMGDACAAVARKLNEIMTALYAEYKDIEFCVMGIGDLAYDNAPIQMSQYESDERILESLDKVYFEAGGGGNGYESYTSAWYMGLYHTRLDCWKRGRKGIIITMGDEPLNPYLPVRELREATGDGKDNITETEPLYEEVIQKFDVYHIAISDTESSFFRYEDRIKNSFGKLLGENLLIADSEKLPNIISQIVKTSVENGAFITNTEPSVTMNETGEISW